MLQHSLWLGAREPCRTPTCLLQQSVNTVLTALKPSVLSPCRALGREPAYPRSLQKHSGYTLEQLQPAAHALSQLHAKVH